MKQPVSRPEVARRRNQWSSPDEMFEAFLERRPFDRWERAVLRDYCRYGLVQNPDGEGYVLACPPWAEQASYELFDRPDDIYDEVGRLDIPVRIIRATPRTQEAKDMSLSPCAPDAASHFRHGEDVFTPQYTHFIAMEDTAFIAGQLLEMLPR
jgi:hypothetical protein